MVRYRLHLLLFVTLTLCVFRAHAENQARHGLYIGVRTGWGVSPAADFGDAQLMLVEEEYYNYYTDQTALSTTAYVLPELVNKAAFGIAFGVRLSHFGFSGEIAGVFYDYTHTVADEYSHSGDRSITEILVNLDVLYFLNADRRLRPYLLVGLCPCSQLNIDDGTYTRNISSVDSTISYQCEGDAEVEGIGFDIGAGVSWYVFPAYRSGYSLRTPRPFTGHSTGSESAKRHTPTGFA